VALPATPVVEVKKVDPWERVRREAKLLVVECDCGKRAGEEVGEEYEEEGPWAGGARVNYR
jgi:hypothetical protein